MKNRTFRVVPKPAPRLRRRGTSRLFVLGAALAASAVAGPTLRAEAGQADRGARPATPSGQAALESDRPFAIAAGPLADVVARFERLTGIHVTMGMEGIGEIQSPGVNGRFASREGLAHLLAGTGVTVTFTAPDAARLDIPSVAEFVMVSAGAPASSSPKYTQPLRDTPQTIVVIPQAIMAEQAATSLRDALRNTPGITLTAGEGGTAPGDNLLIRGFSARNDVYVDGARDPGVVSRDTFNTEMIEVAKGPSSVTAGRGSTGGSVNLVTKAASFQNAATMRATLGNAQHRRTTLDVNRRLAERVAVRLNGMWQDTGVPRRDEVTQKGWGLAPSVRVGLGARSFLTFGYQHLHQNNLPDYGLPGTLPDLAVAAGQTVNALDFSSFYGLPSRDHERVSSNVATVTVDHRFTPTLSLRNLTRYGRNNLDRIVTSPRAATAANAGSDPGFDPTVPQIRRTDTKYQYRTDRTVANQTDVTLGVKTGAVDHDVEAGLEVARDVQPSYAVTDTFANGRPPVTSLFSPNPADAYTPALNRTGASSAARSTSGALYAFDTLKLGSHWQVDLGSRWDRIDVDYATVLATGAASAFGRTDSVVSGRAGIVYKPVTRGTLYAAYSTSFNPSYDGSFGLTLAAGGVNGAALPPERSRNMEAGAKWEVRPTLFATAALFSTEKTNAKTTDASGATILAGDQQVRGIELGVSGNLTSRWGIFSGLSLMDGRVKESSVAADVDKRLSYVPTASFNVWMTWRLPVRLTLGGGAQFTDGYFFNNSNTLSTANAAAIQDLTRYWLFSVVGIFEMTRHVSVQVNATNLANTRYVDRGYTGHFVPGAGRAVVAGPVLTF